MCDRSATSSHESALARPAGNGALSGRFAFVLSAATSPFLVLPAFAAILTWHHSPDWRHFLWWSAIAVFFSTGVPFLYILIGTLTGHITDLHVMRREQRSGPFVVSLASSATGAGVLHGIGAPMPLVAMGVAIVANGVVFTLITLRWKISMHPSVFTACIITSAVLVDTRVVCLLALLPAIVWARARRTRHSVPQGIAAVLVAAGVTLGVLALFGYLRLG